MIGLQELTSRNRSRGSSSQTLFSAEPVTAGNTSAFAGYKRTGVDLI